MPAGYLKRLVALSALSLAALSPQVTAAGESTAAKQITELVASARSESETASASLSRKIAALGAEALPEILAYLERGTLGEEGEALTEWQEHAIVSSLSGFKSHVVRSEVAALATPTASAERRVCLLHVLGQVGRMRDVRTMLDLALDAAEGVELPWEVEYEFHVALGQILGRDEEQVTFLLTVILESEADGRRYLLETLGEVATIEAIQVLARCLGDDDLDGFVMRTLRNSSAKVVGEADDIALDRIRGYLESEQTPLLRDASYALGNLGDFESVEALIGILSEHSDPLAKRAAHESLTTLTGLRFGTDANRWSHWYESEKAWFDTRSADTFRDLNSPSPLKILAGLNEACRHRLYRAEIARQVAVGLHDSRPQVRAKVCMALGQIGSDAVVAELIERFDDSDDNVRKLAWQALRIITQRNLPFDAHAWKEALKVKDGFF